MKLRCKNDELKKALALACSVISKTNTTPLFQNVKITAPEDGPVTIFAMNYAASIIHTIHSAEVESPGVIAISGARLEAISKDWHDDAFCITAEGGGCSINGKRGSFKLSSADVKDFPQPPVVDGKSAFEIDSAALTDMLMKTAFIITAMESKSSNGIFLEITDKDAVMVSNDGRRLACVKRKAHNPEGVSARCIIHAGVTGLILKAVSGREDAIRVCIDDRRIVIMTTDAIVTSQLIEGAYPNYEEVIPCDLDKTVSIERQAFVSAVNRAAIMTTAEYKLLVFTFKDNTLTIRCVSPDTGESLVEIPVEYSGDAVSIGLNPDYVRDFLKTTNGDTIKLKLRDANTAALFTEGNNYRYVLMPMDLEM